MFKYRFIAVIVMLLTIYFSNTPSLMVADPDTWLNSTEYESLAPAAIVSSDSHFLDSWSEVKDYNFYLHKISHVTFYALIAFFLLTNSKSISSVFRKLCFLFIFALCDEIHQYYVVGRSGRLIDTLLDFTSVCTILIILIIFKKLLVRRKTDSRGE